MNDNPPVKGEITPEERAIVDRLYRAIDHLAKSVVGLSVGNLSVSIVATAYLQGDDNTVRPVTVGTTASPGAHAAAQHMQGAVHILKESGEAIEKKAAEDDKVRPKGQG